MKNDLIKNREPLTTREIDLSEYSDIVFGNRWLILCITVACLALGMLYACLSTPIYQADMLLQIEDNTERGGSGNLVTSISSLFQVKSVAAGEIELLRSRRVVSPVVDNLQLDIEAIPRYFPIVGRWLSQRNLHWLAPGLFGMNGYAWGQESLTIERFDIPKPLEDSPFSLTVLPGGRYRLQGKRLNAAHEGKVGQVLMFSTHAGEVALLVTAIRAQPGVVFDVIKHTRNAVIAKIQRQLDIQEKGKQQSGVIGVRLEGTDPTLTARIMNEIGAEYVRQNVDRKSAEAAKSLDFLDMQLPKLQALMEKAELTYSEFRRKNGTFDVESEGRLTLQQGGDIQAQLLPLEQKRADLMSRFAPAHPSIVTIDEQIAVLKRMGAEIDRRMRSLPSTEQEVMRRSRDVRVYNDLYLSLVQSAQQLSLLKAGKVGTVRVVDKAEVPEVPVKPMGSQVLMFSGLIGLLLGAVVAIVKDRMFGGITKAEEIERHVGLSVYATVPYARAQKVLSRQVAAKAEGTFMLAKTHPHDPAIESLRSFRTAMQFAMLDASNPVIVLTGPTPAVGKTFLCANFATLLANGGKRVLLIDADIRRGYLHQYFGRSCENGLSDVLINKLDLSKAIHHTSIENLDFLSKGTMPQNPADVLLHAKFPMLIETLSRAYDFVLIDGPPVLAVADTGILAGTAGTTFMVARVGHTRVGELVESVRRLSQNGTHVKGVLLNSVKPHAGYAHGGKYGGYRYVAYDYSPKNS